jgi:hypothetical protein
MQFTYEIFNVRKLLVFLSRVYELVKQSDSHSDV